jgi:hypothetical protein
MPGVTIANNCVIAAAGVVTRDVPANCFALGCPARIVETGIETGPFGVIRRAVDAKFSTSRSAPAQKGGFGRPSPPRPRQTRCPAPNAWKCAVFAVLVVAVLTRFSLRGA